MGDEISDKAFGLNGPEDVVLIAAVDPQSVLAGGWNFPERDDLESCVARLRGPFTARFPGLAPTRQARLPSATLRAAVAAEQSAFLGLVAVSRPADVPAAVGWSVFGADRPGGPQVRSLENRGNAALRGSQVRCQPVAG
jgi:hypothetical protein